MSTEDDFIEAAMDRAEEELEINDSDAPEPEEVETDDQADEPAEKPKATKGRDKSGRFTKEAVKAAGSEEDAEGEEEPTEEGDEEFDQDADTLDEGEHTDEDAAPVEVPQWWSDEGKAAFANAPREVQLEIARHEQRRVEWHNRFNAEIQRSKNIERRAAEVFQPYEAKLRASGAKDPFEAADRLLAWNDMIEADPMTAIGTLMARAGITPHDFLEDDGSSAPENGYQDPRVTEALRKAEEAERRLNEFQTRQAQAATDSEVEAFKSGVDARGNRRADFVARFEPQIARAVAEIKQMYPQMPNAEALTHAYEYTYQEVTKMFGGAPAANGTSNGPGGQPQKKPDNASIIARAKKAKAASGSVTGAPSNGVGSPRPRKKYNSFDELLDAAVDSAEAQHGLS